MRLTSGSDIAMVVAHVRSDEATPAAKAAAGLIGAAKPYLAAALIVTILLSIWAGLCAA
jgi:hypothetical protein